MDYHQIVQTVARELDMPEELVDKTYKAFWLNIKSRIIDLPLKEDLDEQTFNSLRTSFNIPSLGKLCCTYDRMLRVKKRYEYIQRLRNIDDKCKENKTDVHSSHNNS